MIFIKLLIAVIFAISTLLVFDTRNIVKRYFMNEDRNDMVFKLRIIGYISIIISIFLVKMFVIY
ncbi:MAG: hypothetical protein HG454_003150 [Clostridiales bacterium]|nr:hypothetical protein [Clostridiales bacterium]